MYSFLTDKDFPRRNNTKPDTWRNAVMALRGEMATHPTIVSSAHLFCLEISIIEWGGGGGECGGGGGGGGGGRGGG